MLSKIAASQEAQALAVVMPILILIVIDDLRNFRIRNHAVVALLALFGAFCLTNGGFATFKSNLLFGFTMFAACLLMYRLRMMGGGDVKLLAVAFLWMGVECAPIFSMLLGIFALIYAAGAKLYVLPSRLHHGRMKVPYGPTISLAWTGAALAKIIM